MSGTHNDPIDLEDPAFEHDSAERTEDQIMSSSDLPRQTRFIEPAHEDGRPDTILQAPSESMQPPSTTPAIQPRQTTLSGSMPPPSLPTQAGQAQELQAQPRTLTFASTHQALANLRIQLTRFANDDFNAVRNNEVTWVHRILDAFDADYDHTPDDTIKKRFTGQVSEEWQKWQDRAAGKEDGSVEKPRAKKQAAFSAQLQQQSETLARQELEQNVWLLLDGIIDMHEHGYLRTMDSLDPRLICSARVAEVIDIMTRYMIVREDVAKGDLSAMRSLAADPWGHGQRKVQSLGTNTSRGKRTQARRGSEVSGGAGRQESIDEDFQMFGRDGSRSESIRSSFGSSHRRRFSAISARSGDGDDRPVPFPAERDRFGAPVTAGSEEDEDVEEREYEEEQVEEEQGAVDRLREELARHAGYESAQQEELAAGFKAEHEEGEDEVA